jgi:hypothetical protein
MKKSFTSVIIVAAGMVLAGVMVSMSGVPREEAVAFTKSTGVTPGVGTNYGYAKYTNSAGSIVITPSNGVVSFTFADISGFPAPYHSVAIGLDSVTGIAYGTNTLTNTVTIPVSTNSVTTNDSYKLMVYIMNNPPPPSNGVPIILSLVQNTN